MSYPLDFSLALGSSQVGLSIEAQFVDSSGDDVGSPITTGFVEVGLGNYLFSAAAIPDGHRGGVIFRVAGGGQVKAFAAINPEEYETQGGDLLAEPVPGSYAQGTAGYALGRIGSASITVTSPVALGGKIKLMQGDDYLAVDGRALEWVDTTNKWPDLTGASILFLGAGLIVAGTVITPSGVNKKVQVELTAAQTSTLVVDRYQDYQLKATLAGGTVVTLVFAEMLAQTA